jgi:WD40 repeat protein
LLAVGDDGGVVTIVDIAQKTVLSAQSLHPRGVCGVVPATEPAAFVCVGSAGGTIIHANRTDPSPLDGQIARTYLAACDPAGRFIATAASGGTVDIWAADTAQLTVSYNVEANPANALDWSPSGRFLVVGLDSGDVAVIDFNDGSPTDS